jgi:hypothetical protein
MFGREGCRTRLFGYIGGMNFTATAETLPAYPCDICHQDVVAGERVTVTDGGLTVEHTACTAYWFRSNFGRETLHA